MKRCRLGYGSRYRDLKAVQKAIDEHLRLKFRLSTVRIPFSDPDAIASSFSSPRPSRRLTEALRPAGTFACRRPLQQPSTCSSGLDAPGKRAPLAPSALQVSALCIFLQVENSCDGTLTLAHGHSARGIPPADRSPLEGHPQGAAECATWRDDRDARGHNIWRQQGCCTAAAADAATAEAAAARAASRAE